MKSLTITTLLALLSATSALPRSTTTSDNLLPRGLSAPTCETSAGSPLVTDLLDAAHVLTSQPSQFCQQRNPFGSQCTLISSRGTAAISMCRDFQLRCGQVGEAAEAVARECVAEVGGGVRAGGFVEYRDGRVYGRINVHHT